MLRGRACRSEAIVTAADRPRLEAPAPSLLRVLGETRAVGDFAALLWHLPALGRLPRGRGEPVLVLPGFGAGDGSTWALRAFLRSLGWDAHGWGLGINRGDVPALVRRVSTNVVEGAQRSGRRVRLVGWSLGGYLAREVARERPDAVERVVTLGSPVVGGPKYTVVAGLYRRRGYDLDAIEAEVEARNRTPIAVPVTAIYSRRDGVVAWQACVDRSTPDVEHVEVETTHVGLGFNATVYRVVAERLARRRSG